MRLFLIWPSNDPEELKVIMPMLAEQGHEIVYWLGSPAAEAETLPGTIFHSYEDAQKVVPPQILNSTQFPPPGADLIESLYQTESFVLTMMNNAYDKLCVDERRRMYYNLVQYWHGVLKKYNPDAVIFPVMPHAVYDYIIYELAHLLGIKTLVFNDTWISARMISYNDFWSGNVVLRQELAKSQGKNFQLADLADDIKEYYKQRTGMDANTPPVYISRLKNEYSLSVLLKKGLMVIRGRSRNFSIFKQIWNYFWDFFRYNLKKEYSGLQRPPDWSKKFIYVPLNYQPERTTCPEGGIFSDQILMIEVLAASVPSDWIIYAKEHPMQWQVRGVDFSSVRYRGYYERIAKLKNVRLIPVETDTFRLIREAQVVATVTGTAGWEAILRGKSALIFGYPWYRDCPGAYRVQSVIDCQNALQAISASGPVPEQSVINYLKAFEVATVRAFIAPAIKYNTKLSKTEGVYNLGQAIIAGLAR